MSTRLVLLLVLLTIVTVPLARASEPATSGGPDGAVEMLPPGPEPVPLIAEGVVISGVAVGGLSPVEAEAAVQAAFDAPLVFRHKSRRWSATPAELGARADVEGAVARALAAPPGSLLTLDVTVWVPTVRAYVDDLARRFSRPARDSVLRLVKLRPRISKPHAGLRVEKGATTGAIVRALKTGDRGPIALRVKTVRPRVTPAGFGPIIVIRRESKHLHFYEQERFVRRLGVATGQASYPTPLGRFVIVVKARNPWWFPPSSDWAKGLKPVPPGPGNPLGTRWMGLSAPGVGIHGTPDAASIGYSASHGCIRMLIPDAEWLFERVRIGTPVFIVGA